MHVKVRQVCYQQAFVLDGT